MKVYIGPYKDWIGPYQIANWLQKIGVSEDRYDGVTVRNSRYERDVVAEAIGTGIGILVS